MQGIIRNLSEWHSAARINRKRILFTMRFITHEEGYEVTTKNHGKVTVNAGQLEFPQVDSVPEFVEFCGGEPKAIDLINDLLYSRSKNGALALVRNATSDSSPADAVKRAADYSKNYNPAQERFTKAAAAEAVDALREAKDKLKDMSQEEMLAFLSQTFKL